MKEPPHITVIIPTRERADVLESSLQTCTTQDYDNLTIIVSDNFSQDQTSEIARGANDPRVRYLNTGKRVSMSHNYEFALSHVNDGWVTIIGDDDGLLPQSLGRTADLIKSTDVQAIRSDVCLYRWPGLLGSASGTLTVPLKRGFEIRKSREWLSRVMHGTSLYPNLPMLYSGGFAKVSVLKSIKARKGQFYHSCIPDVYSAFAIASVIDSYIWSFEPFAIDGVSRHSTGTSLINRAIDRSAAQKFFAEENIPLHPHVPTDANGQVPRVHQAWIYESYLQSRFLRDEPNGCTPEGQLKIALSSPGLDAAVSEWGKAFAHLHGLDFSLVYAEVKRNSARLRLSEGSRRLQRVLNTYYFPPEQAGSLTNVYQASLAAGKLLDHPPSGFQTLRSIASKALASRLRTKNVVLEDQTEH